MMKMHISFLSAALAISLLIAGCGRPGSPAVRRVAGRLNPGGTYYYLADKTLLPEQLNFILDRIRPAIAPALEQTGIPFDFDMMRSAAAKFCAKSGLTRIQATGASSIILYGSAAKPPVFFHNRAVMDTGSGDLPAFLTFFSGDKVWLNDFARAVPDDAVSAAIGNFNPEAFWKWLQSAYQLPPQVASMIEMYANCPPEEFFAGISGPASVIVLSPNPLAPRAAYKITDRGSRLFKMIGKLLLVDVEKEHEITLPLPKNVPPGSGIDKIWLRQSPDTLELFVGAETAEHIATHLADQSTYANRPDFKQLRLRIPDSATAYGIGNYGIFDPLLTPDDEPTGNQDYVWISASDIGSGGVSIWLNSYCDWNGMPFEVLLGMLPQLSNIMQAVQNIPQGNSTSAPDAEAATVACTAHLKQIGVACMMYKVDYNDQFPAPAGVQGLRRLAETGYFGSDLNVLICPADSESTTAADPKQLDWANVSYVYYGAPAAGIAPADCPLASEHPIFRHQGDRCNVLFADGHVESLAMPEDVDSIEELMSFLHTRKHYPEAALKELTARGHKLDEELNRE